MTDEPGLELRKARAIADLFFESDQGVLFVVNDARRSQGLPPLERDLTPGELDIYRAAIIDSRQREQETA